MIFKDQLNRDIEIIEFPKRIVSLVPSQTELLFDLGLDEEIIGITKFCIHPKKWHQNKTRIGGTKKVNIQKIKSLNPDLIICNKEENTKEEIELLAKEFSVWISDIKNLSEALNMINGIGEITGKSEKAEMLIHKIEREFSALQPLKTEKKALYLIWKEPWMSVNSETFIHDMLVRCGFTNITQNKTLRYPDLTEQELVELNPNYVFLSSEPFPFKEKHIQELQEILPKAKIMLVDGEAFSWYGSHLLRSVEYFKKLIKVS
jgi:ABC-type Fe3+-hydroxamate transport system substrate-binding protein